MRSLIDIVENQNNLSRWFGRSVVANPDGSPKRVFHGTANNIDKFEKGLRGAGSRESKIGYWFTSNTDAASSFASFAQTTDGSGPNLVPVYLKIERPLYLETYDQLRDLVDQYTEFERQYIIGGRNIRMQRDKVDYDRLISDLKQKYDGIIIPSTLTDSPDGITKIDQIIVFDRNQIKSAISNNQYSDSDYISESE